MMGLTGNGGFNQEDVDYTMSYNSKEDKQKANIKVINNRINNLINNNELLDFYTNKAMYTWSDGTFFAPKKLSVYPVHNYKIKDYILPNNNKNKLYIIIAQTQLLLILLFNIIGIVLRKYLTKKQQLLQLFLNITIFGILIFFLIWETRSRYLVNMLPILLLSSFLGINAIVNYKERNN
jgi:hypothetical protein